MNTVNVTLQDGQRVSCPLGTPVSDLLSSRTDDSGLDYVGALVNNDVASLSYPLTVNSSVLFLTMADAHGWRVYRRSLCFLAAKAVRQLFPDSRFMVEHSFGLGLYCSFSSDGASPRGITKEQLSALHDLMRNMVDADLKIERRKVSFTDAVRHFEESGQSDKLNLLKYRNPPRVVIHWCGDFSDLAHGPLVPSTGVLTAFELLHYPPGFVLHLPEREDPTRIPPFEDQPHLFTIFQEHKEWGRILGVSTVGNLNAIIAAREFAEFTRTAEALHEKKLACIADQIAESRERTKLVLIAGPSSSGKTTLAKRLMTHLRVNGIRPVTIATDNYFVGVGRNPRDEDGNPDYEHLEAVDLDLFNDQLSRIVEGEEVELPYFNFLTKQREFRGQKLQIDEDQIVLIEGIHGLNPKLTHMVAAERKFKIYISALTQLNVDSHNRVSTTDNRLMRRLVRDHKFRGHSALDTLQLWPSVRRGEKRWIFPFQKEADATFNSALDYELAVLKPLVESLLMQVKPYHEEYAEARRLTEFLLHFLAAPDAPVPGNSILREYIGGSSLTY